MSAAEFSAVFSRGVKFIELEKSKDQTDRALEQMARRVLWKGMVPRECTSYVASCNMDRKGRVSPERRGGGLCSSRNTASLSAREVQILSTLDPLQLAKVATIQSRSVSKDEQLMLQQHGCFSTWCDLNNMYQQRYFLACFPMSSRHSRFMLSI